MIQLLLVDDQALIRRGLRALLKADPELQIVGEAEHGEAAIALVEQLGPHVVLMDVRMPVMDGVAATQQIVQRFPDTKVLVLTTFDDREYVSQVLQHGASGYLLKDTPFEELTQAIRLVHKGYTQLGPGIAQKLAMAYAVPSPTANLAVNLVANLGPGPNASHWEDLTPREQEILQLIAAGASNREIAQQLFISEKTVKNHITSILGRLELRDRTQAAIWVHSVRHQ